MSGGGAGPAELVEVADQVFAYIQPDGSWWINNAGFVVGGKAVVSVDACSTRARTSSYLERITTVTRAPVTTLINTHHHGDHTFGNYLFDSATIVAHEKCRAALLQAGLPPRPGVWDPVDWGDIELAPPTLTFTDRITLWSDDDPIEVNYVGGPAHTDNDSVVWLPRHQVLFCGDLLFNGGTPFLLMGSVTGAISVLTDVVAGYPATVIVPGHGAPCDGSLIAVVVDYLRFVLDVAERGIVAGIPPLDAARQTDLGRYTDWLDTERIVGNLHRAYCDLDPTAHPLDIAGALADMVAYNGGPLTCYA